MKNFCIPIMAAAFSANLWSAPPPAFAQGSADAPAGVEEKLDQLEQKLDALSAKIDRVLQGQSRIRPGGPGAPGGQGGLGAARAVVSEKVYEMEVGDAFTRGPDDAAVTIVMWLDFAAPASARAAPFVAQILEAYPDDVRFAFKHYPLPIFALGRPAARVAIAAGRQGKFWEMFTKLSANYDRLKEDKFEDWAKEIGLDLDRFDVDVGSDETAAHLDADLVQARSLNIHSVPQFYINGRRPGGIKLERWGSFIDEEVARAKGEAKPAAP